MRKLFKAPQDERQGRTPSSSSPTSREPRQPTRQDPSSTKRGSPSRANASPRPTSRSDSRISTVSKRSPSTQGTASGSAVTRTVTQTSGGSSRATSRALMTPAAGQQQASDIAKQWVVEQIWINAYDNLTKGQDTKKLVHKYESILMNLYMKDSTEVVTSFETLSTQDKLPIMQKVAWESYQKARETGRHRELVSNGAKFFSNLESILRPVMVAHTVAAFAWAGVFSVLTMLTKPLDVTSAMKDVLLYTSNQTRWFTDNVNMWLAENEGGLFSQKNGSRREELRTEIQNFFELIMEYIMRCIIHIRRDPITKVASAVIQPDLWWKQGLEKLKSHRAYLEEHLKQITDQKDQQKKRHDLQRKLISTFKPNVVNDIPTVLARNSTRATNTCLWFCEHPNFKNWLQGSMKHLLVSADPGSGKTILSAYLIQEVLPKHFVNAIIISYFFDHASRADLAPALSTLLYQLFVAKPELAVICEETIEKAGSNNSGLKGILSMAVSHPSCPPVICVLDALDECNADERRDLEAMVRNQSSQYKLRFLMTTRSYPDIVDRFTCTGSNCRHISAEEPRYNAVLRNEIKSVLKSRLEVLAKEKRLRFSETSELSIAMQKGGGHQTTYIWLSRLFSSLEAPGFAYRPSTPKTIVDGPHNYMDATYKGFLQRVAPESRPSLRVIFHLLIAASRPLTVSELEIALRANARWNARTLPGSEEKALGLWGPERFQRWLRTLSHLFIAVQGEKVHFLHHTAREFLSRPSGENAWYSVNPREAQRVMVESCLPYLSLRQFKTTDFEKQVQQRYSQQGITFHNAAHGVFGKQYKFLIYALQYWPQHFQQISQKDITNNIRDCYIALLTPSRSQSIYEVTPAWLLLYQSLQGWTPTPQSSDDRGSHSSSVSTNPRDIPSKFVIYGGAVARWDHHQMIEYFVPLFGPHPPPPPPEEVRGKLLYMTLLGSALNCLEYLTDSRFIKAYINNKMNGEGKTPLAWVASNFGKHIRNLEMANILLNRGADKALADNNNVLPFSHFVHGLKYKWPFDTDFERHKQRRDYISLGHRLMLSKEDLKKLSQPALASYNKSLTSFNEIERRATATRGRS